MKYVQRIKYIFEGLCMIGASALMLYSPDDGYILVAAILSVSLFIRGVSQLIYYFSMARHMVGGKMILYRAVLFLDLGILIMSTIDIPRLYIIMYLLVAHAFAGAIDVLRAFEARKLGAAWKNTLTFGIANILLATLPLVGGIFFDSARIIVYLYSAGLIYSGIVRIVSAFRRTSILFVA